MAAKVDISLDEFMSKVNKRNTDKQGNTIDPNLLRRMDHPICRKCHTAYREKYPGKPFEPVCEGIYDQIDYEEIQLGMLQEFPEEEPIPIESLTDIDIREVYDKAWWGAKHTVYKDDNGLVQPFEVRDYQEGILRCTAVSKIDRLGRGLGKTSLGVIEELHAVCNKGNYEVLVICPADSQSEKWWNEILFQIDNSLTLKNVLLAKKQQPFRHMEFHNGSTINIFTAGSAAGRGADSLRSQSPRRIRIDEQDYLVDKDWDAIGALLTRYKNSEFHGSSTPTGAHGKYWEMCTQNPSFKEFYFPIMVHPDWGEELEIKCREMAKTEERYQHEYLAEFGDSTQGVFKNFYIDLAKTKYFDESFPKLVGYDTVRYDASKSYFMGVDWNGEGTGTRIRVIEYDSSTAKSRMAYKLNVDYEGFTVFDSIEAVVSTNRKWHCEDIYIDAGFGSAQADMIKAKGKGSRDPDDKKLQFVTVVDFGANLKFNKLKPNRDPNKRASEEEYDRPTKPFMVEGAVMRFEQRLIEFSEDDLLLEDQLRNYKVKTYTQHGWANSYTAGKSGDHDLDAFMLALLAIEIKYGFYAQYRPERRQATVSYASGFGVASAPSDKALEQVKDRAGVNVRTNPVDKANARLDYLSHTSMLMTPIRSNSSTPASRTAIFGQKGTRMGNISDPKSRRGRY